MKITESWKGGYIESRNIDNSYDVELEAKKALLNQIPGLDPKLKEVLEYILGAKAAGKK